MTLSSDQLLKTIEYSLNEQNKKGVCQYVNLVVPDDFSQIIQFIH